MYDGINEGNESITPARNMSNELRLSCRLHPHIRLDLKKSFSGIVICTYASLEDGAVVLVKASPDVAERLTGMNPKQIEEGLMELKANLYST